MRPLDAPDDAASGAATSPEGLAPRRLLDGGGTPFERLLVEPSRSGGVPRASLVRLAHALKLPPEALPAPSSEALPALPPETPLSRPPEGQPARGSRLARQASLARLGVVGLVVGAVAVVGVRHGPEGPAAALPANPAALGAAPVAPELAVAATRPAAEPSAASTLPVATPTAASRATSAAVETRATTRAGSRRAARQPLRAAPSEAAIEAPSRGLGAELRALEGVQQALLERRASAAGSALADYRKRFPNGELALEAELLGVEVALQAGHPEHARARALELSAHPGAARYRERLEALTRAAEAIATPRQRRPTAGGPL